MEFAGKNILITGGSKGLGAYLAKLLAAKGSKIILFSRNEEKLKEVCQNIIENGGEAQYIVGNVTNSTDIEKLHDFIVKKYGVLDILINNAGILTSKGFDSSYEDFEKIMDVNVNGYMRILTKLLPIVGRDVVIKKKKKEKTQKKGMIIIVSSVSSIIIPPTLQFYGISKHATRAMSVALRQHLLFYGFNKIKVLNVNPPQFETDIYEGSGLEGWIEDTKKRGWLLTTERIALDIIKAIKKEKEEINISFFGKIASFGIKYFPRIMYYFTRRQY